MTHQAQTAAVKLSEEQIVELERKARNCRDNAHAEMVIHDAFMPEYVRGISGHVDASKETHSRSLEIYDFTIRGKHRAEGFLRDAELLEVAAAMGRSLLAQTEG